MQSIRSFLLTAAGIAFTLMALVFTASLGVALAGIVAVLMALFLWMTDKTLEWVFYDLLLGWRK